MPIPDLEVFCDGEEFLLFLTGQFLTGHDFFVCFFFFCGFFFLNKNNYIIVMNSDYITSLIDFEFCILVSKDCIILLVQFVEGK